MWNGGGDKDDHGGGDDGVVVACWNAWASTRAWSWRHTRTRLVWNMTRWTQDGFGGGGTGRWGTIQLITISTELNEMRKYKAFLLWQLWLISSCFRQLTNGDFTRIGQFIRVLHKALARISAVLVLIATLKYCLRQCSSNSSLVEIEVIAFLSNVLCERIRRYSGGRLGVKTAFSVFHQKKLLSS